MVAANASRSSISLALLLTALLCGCANQGYSVIASTATTIGVGISQQPASGVLDATLGYKRAEVAFVPSNRNSGESAGSTGNGAKDTGNVIMELRYSGIFSPDAAIYQRLAVGETAVAQNGTALLFAKGPDGKVDAESIRALLAVKGIAPVDSQATASKAPLSVKYMAVKASGDPAAIKQFNDAVAPDFSDFEAFLVDPKTPDDKVRAVRKSLESAGITFQ